MRLLVSSDWHLDTRTAGIDRFDELEQFVGAFVHASREADLVLNLGDFFDPGAKLAPLYTSLMLEAFDHIRKSGPEVIVIAGNHDVVETSQLVTNISPLRVLPIHVCEHAEYIELEEIDVLALPYTAKAFDDHEIRIEELEKARMRPPGRKLVVLSHLSVPGASLGSESKEMARGRDEDFPFNEVAALEPTLVLQGHYHRRQVVKSHGIEIVIPGSPIRVTFGERKDTDKGFTWVEV